MELNVALPVEVARQGDSCGVPIRPTAFGSDAAPAALVRKLLPVHCVALWLAEGTIDTVAEFVFLFACVLSSVANLSVCATRHDRRQHALRKRRRAVLRCRGTAVTARGEKRVLQSYKRRYPAAAQALLHRRGSG